MDNRGLRGLKVLPTVLCVCQTLLFTCPFACSLLFHTQPVSVVQKQGGAVHLHCLALPPSASVSWRFQGRALEQGALPGVVIQPGTLSLPSLQLQHAGSYRCVARLDTDAIVSRLAQVTVADIEDFPETHRRSVAVKLGDAAFLECPLPRSNPPALPRYKIRGKWLEESTDEYLILPSGSLQIASVSPEHQGVYKCGAYNPVTKELKVEAHGTKVIVKDSVLSPVGIVFPVDPVKLTVEQSVSLVLECVVSGNLSVRWMKDGLELALVPRMRRLQNNLLLSDSQLSDAGNYTCLVQSEDGATSSASYAVEVLGAPSLTRGLSDQSVTSGSSVQFTCETSGNPVPEIAWFFNASPISPSLRIRRSGSSLHIVSVTTQDQGMYQCLLENALGSTQSAGRLTVRSAKTSLPMIVSPPQSGVYEEGRSVFLFCNASGLPVPAISWYNSAGPVPTRSKASSVTVTSQPGSSTLTIQAVSRVHAGKYVCEASNGLGSVQVQAFLTVERPGTAATDTRPSVHPVQRDEGGGLHMEEELGDAIRPSTKRTSDKPTPEAPIIISPPQTHKPNTYDLEWRPGRDWGNPITAYFVKYRKVDDVGSVVGSWHTVRVPGSEKNLPLSDLEPSSLYEVLMVARSAAGEGQPAMLTFRTGKERTTSSSSGKNPSKAPVVSVPEKVPEDKTSNTHFGVVIHDRVPEAPDRPTISMASENSVYVTWIPRANGGSPITAFRVEYRKQGRSTDWIIAADNISPLKLSVEVRNLEPGSTYRFRVIALNIYGESPHSGTSRPYQVAMTSQPTSNRPVTGPHITSTDAVSDTQIMVRWTYTPSSNNNTPIQGFYIYYRPTDSDNDGDYKKDVVEGAKRWHMIGQLQSETSYDIKMQCFNEAGKSDYSNVMICETKARQPPGVPTQRPVTPPGVYPPSAPSSGSGVLYLIVGCVLGVMVLILLVFIVICLWRNRQQHNMQKHSASGYLYQPPDMNSHMMEYTTLPASSQLNGGMHASYGHNGAVMPHACRHLHHKLANGFTALNGPGSLYRPGHSRTHDTPVPHNNVDYEFPHPHHVHNGQGLYPSATQKNSDCMNCQNFCNNNRCYTKANGSFPGGTLPLMHHMVPCQLDSIEMVPLNRGPVRCHDKSSLQPCGNCDQEDGIREERQDDSLTTASQKSLSDTEKLDPSTDTGRESVRCKTSAESLVCLEMLDEPDLDCKEKPAWISTSPITGDLLHPTAQEI